MDSAGRPAVVFGYCAYTQQTLRRAEPFAVAVPCRRSWRHNLTTVRRLATSIQEHHRQAARAFAGDLAGHLAG